MLTVLLAAPILLTLTLLVSGLAKLGARRGTEDAMTSLRLPLRGAHRTVASVLPAAEIVLALGLWVPLVPLQIVVSVLIALLMISYLVIIARALTWDEVVECSCFGSLGSPTVSRTTLLRNAVLTSLAVVTVIAARLGLLTEVLVQAPLVLVGAGASLLLAVVLTAVTLDGTEPAPDPRQDRRTGHGDREDDEEPLDYERTPIPAGVLQRPDGRLITLRQLSARRAVLLVFVSEGCGPCERVLDRVPGWIEELEASMEVRVVLSRPVEALRERTTARVGAQVLHDLQFSAREALGGTTAPSAVLLGADGLLAGGPVHGGDAVIDFVDEIREQLTQLTDASSSEA